MVFTVSALGNYYWLKVDHCLPWLRASITYLGPLFLRSHWGWFPRVLPPFKVLPQSNAL